MGAIIIGIGLVIGAAGVVLGLIGAQSLAQPSGTALVIVGTLGFVGGLLLAALGLVHRALIDIGHKLDGVVHVEADEYYDMEPREHVRPAALHEEPHEELARAAPVTPPPFVPAKTKLPEPEPVELAPEPPVAPPAPLPVPAAKESSGGLPSWFRRKRAPEPAPAEPEPEPVLAAEPDFSKLATESSELPAFELSDLLEPEPVPGEAKPFESKPFESKPFDTKPAPAAAPVVSKPVVPEPKVEAKPPAPPAPEPKNVEAKSVEPKSVEPKPVAPRPPEPARPEASRADADEGPGAPPAFLQHGSDLVDEAPGITVLKAGVIGGMAYKLFSDGSIEAELPDGTLRFASLQDLRDHVSGAGQG